MLIVHRLAQGGHRYYLASVGRGEPPGTWWGSAASSLGLSGMADPSDLRRVLPRGPGRVPGFDLTFAAPKSVSLLHALGPADVVATAHDRAVAAGLGYVERHAALVRVGGETCPAGGVVAATFRHHVSRAGDPHLHTHSLVANAAVDGRALHSALLYAERSGAAAMYHATLRYELTRSLGVSWEAPQRGRADILEVPPELREVFSQRGQVLRDVAIRDRPWAARVTRPEIDGPIDWPRLRGEWAARSGGWKPPSLAPRPPAPGDPTALPPTDSFTRADVMVALASAHRDGATPVSLEAECDRMIAGAVELRPVRNGAARYATVAAVERRARVDRALAAAPHIVARPAELDALRGRFSVVGPDAAAAALLASRVGADVGPSARVVVLNARRIESAEIETLLAGGAEVIVGDRPPVGAHHEVQPGAVATVGQLTVAGSSDAALAAAVEAYVAARVKGEDAVIVAHSSEVDDVNRLARAALRAAGALGSSEVAGLAAGDAVRFPAARPTLGVDRHDVATVVSVDEAVVRLRCNSRDVELPVRSIGALTHAHAVPPVPQLSAGREHVHVLGNWTPRTSAVVHRYVTIEDRARWEGDRKRLEGRRRAAREWIASASSRLAADPRSVVWRSQLAAAQRALHAATPDPDRPPDVARLRAAALALARGPERAVAREISLDLGR